MVGSPDQTAGEEGEEEEHAVVPLDGRACEVEFVAEPMDVEEGGGEFVEEESGGVVIEEGALNDEH